jgi:hypothetical protein
MVSNPKPICHIVWAGLQTLFQVLKPILETQGICVRLQWQTCWAQYRSDCINGPRSAQQMVIISAEAHPFSYGLHFSMFELILMFRNALAASFTYFPVLFGSGALPRLCSSWHTPHYHVFTVSCSVLSPCPALYISHQTDDMGKQASVESKNCFCR